MANLSIYEDIELTEEDPSLIELEEAVVDVLFEYGDGEGREKHEVIDHELLCEKVQDDLDVSEELVGSGILSASLSGYCFELGDDTYGHVITEEKYQDYKNNNGNSHAKSESDEFDDPDSENTNTGNEPEKYPSGPDLALFNNVYQLDYDWLAKFIDKETSTIPTEREMISVCESINTFNSYDWPCEQLVDDLCEALRESGWDDKTTTAILENSDRILKEYEALKWIPDTRLRLIEEGKIEPNPVEETSDSNSQTGSSPLSPHARQNSPPEPREDDIDQILEAEEREGVHDPEPEFPGQMSGESIRLRDGEDDWREPRSMY